MLWKQRNEYIFFKWLCTVTWDTIQHIVLLYYYFCWYIPIFGWITGMIKAFKVLFSKRKRHRRRERNIKYKFFYTFLVISSYGIIVSSCLSSPAVVSFPTQYKQIPNSLAQKGDCMAILVLAGKPSRIMAEVWGTIHATELSVSIPLLCFGHGTGKQIHEGLLEWSV